MFKIIRQIALKESRHMSEQEIAEEHQWVMLAKKDAAAFGKLYDRYFEKIFSFILRRTDDEALADDLTSQAFLKAMQNLKKYEFRGVPFSAWLYRIAHNEVNKHYNKRNSKRIFSLEQEHLFEMIDVDDERAFDDQQIQTLLTTLKELPTDVMEVLELRFFENHSLKEISYVLNIGESAAKMRLYRAIEKLRIHFNINWEA